MSHQEKVFFSSDYVYVRCGRENKPSDLGALPVATCLNCGFRVFAKARAKVAVSWKAN